MFHMTDIFKSCVAQDENIGGILEYNGQMPNLFFVLSIHKNEIAGNKAFCGA